MKRLNFCTITLLLTSVLSACQSGDLTSDSVGTNTTTATSSPSSEAGSQSSPDSATPTLVSSTATNSDAGTSEAGVVVLPRESSFKLDGRIAGTLLMEQGCVVLLSSVDVQRRVRLAWPIGTTWDPQERTITLNDGTVLSDGTTINAPGGLVADGDLATTIGLPNSDRVFLCSGDGTFLVSPDPVIVESTVTAP